MTAVPPLFVFTDDLGVYPTAEAARRDYESWIVEVGIAAYDSAGTVLAVEPGAFPEWFTPTDSPENRRDEFVGRLRRELLLYAVARPDRLDKWQVKHADLDRLVDYAVRFRSHEPSRPTFGKACRYSVAVASSIPALFVIVAASSFASLAAAFGGGMRMAARWARR